MEYRVSVKPYVDIIHVFDVSDADTLEDKNTQEDMLESKNNNENKTRLKYLGMMLPAEDYSTMLLKENDPKSFLIRLPLNTTKIRLDLYGYGKIGGSTEYAINDLISVSIDKEQLRQNEKTKQWVTPIIVNTPFQIGGVSIQLLHRLQQMTGLKEWIQLEHVPQKAIKSQYDMKPSELAARGIDITGKSWFASVVIEPPEWAFTETDEYLRILETQLPATVHCFSLVGQMTLDIDA